MFCRIAPGLVVVAACSGGPVRIAAPNVPEGGRAIAITRAMTDANRMVVATESGGLFRSFDGGISWQHLGRFPNFAPVDVAMSSLDPNTIIATAVAQFRVINDGGIWRSTDGGASWSQPSGWTPPPGPNCPARPSAYGISHQPLTRKFFVGTDCGVAVSDDNGATWQPIVIEASTAADSGWSRVRSLLILGRTFGVAAGDNKLWRLDSTGSWVRATNNPNPPGPPVIHGFAAPWWTGSRPVLFHASLDYRLWRSTDGGDRWVLIPAPRDSIRGPFVRIARAGSQTVDSFDLYWGDGVRVHRHRFRVSDGTAAGPWEHLKSDDADPADIAFDLDLRDPILLASDGGVHRTADRGATWKYTGGGTGGLSALQIQEVTGQDVSGTNPHLDLYYSTQDNTFRASLDGGATWTGLLDGEGAHVRVMPASVDHQGTRVTLRRCGDCTMLMTAEHFQQADNWPSAPSGQPNTQAFPPYLIAGDAYVQGVLDGTDPLSISYYLTLSAGAAWSKSFTLYTMPVGPLHLAGSLANPTVYQGIRRASIPNAQAHGLVRASNLAGTASATRADADSSVVLGFVHMGQARHVIFGVNPGNPNQLIAPDIAANAMKVSSDGGNSWGAWPSLTQAVTDNGRYLLHLAGRSFVTTIAWDPYDECHILVGTHQNGVIRSTDGGVSWSRIEDSPAITWVSSFYFPPSGNVWVSSYGRGLWRLSLQRPKDPPARSCRFPTPPPDPTPEPGGTKSLPRESGKTAER